MDLSGQLRLEFFVQDDYVRHVWARRYVGDVEPDELSWDEAPG